jgi:hypothetical protein
MGYSIEQYGMDDAYSNDYSNAGGCGILHPFNKGKREACEQAKGFGSANTSADTALSKGAVCVKGLPVYIPGSYLLTNKAKRTQNRMICKARKEAKIKDDVVPTDAIKDNPLTDAQAPLTDGSIGASSSKTGMYIGIGVGVLAIGIVAIVLIKRRK